MKNLMNIIELQKKRMCIHGESMKDGLESAVYSSFEDNIAYKKAEHNNEEIGIHMTKSKFKDGLREAIFIPNVKNVIKCGSYVKLLEDNSIWLCAGVEDVLIDRCIFQLCNYDLKFIDGDDNLITKPCILSVKTLYTTGIKDEKIIEIPNGMVGIQLPYDEDTKHIEREQCFIFNKSKYRTTFYNKVEREGLIVLICTEERPNHSKDDTVNEIADRWIEKNGVKVDRLPWLDNKEPPIEEPELPTQDVVYKLKAEMAYPSNPDNEIWWGDSATYTVSKLINGLEVNGLFEFAISDIKSATIISKADNAVTIQASDILDNKNITLSVTDLETDEIIVTKEITIVGRFG